MSHARWRSACSSTAPTPIARGAAIASPRASSARPTGTVSSESGGSWPGGSTAATYVRITRPCSLRHEVECTARGVSGYRVIAAITSSPGLDDGASPMRSESAWTGFSQNSSPSRMKTGRTSSVWATNSAAQAVVERGGPTVSIRISSLPADRLRPRRLPDGSLALGTRTGRAVGDGAPDRAHLGGREVGLVRGTAVGLHVRDHLRLGAARGPAAAARHLHQHPQQAIASSARRSLHLRGLVGRAPPKGGAEAVVEGPGPASLPPRPRRGDPDRCAPSRATLSLAPAADAANLAAALGRWTLTSWAWRCAPRLGAGASGARTPAS